MKIGTTRVETFSDGVLAIIITIMVLAIKLPDFSKEGTSLSIRNHLATLLPFLITYSFSFLMIGIFWVNHHHMFHLLNKTDEPLLLQNLLFLFCTSLIPVATALLGASPLVADSVAFYGLIMLLTTAVFGAMRSYTIRKGLVHTDKDKALNKEIDLVARRARGKSFYGALAYAASVPLAFVSVYAAFVCFAVPPILFFIPDGIDDETLAEQIGEKNTGGSAVANSADGNSL